MKQSRITPRISALRERAKLTQLELSRIVGVTEATIANWEKGRSGIDWIDRMIRLCRALDCSLEDLVEYPVTETAETQSATQSTFASLKDVYKAGKRSETSVGQGDR